MADAFKKYSRSTLESKSKYSLINTIETSYILYDKDKQSWENLVRMANVLSEKMIRKNQALEEKLADVESELADVKKQLEEAENALVECKKNQNEGGRPPKYGDEIRTEVLKMYQNGLTFRKISDKTGVSPATISRLIRKIGMTKSSNQTDCSEKNTKQ